MYLVASVCVYIRVYVYIYIFIYLYIYICGQKNWLFSAIPLENLLLSVMSCLLFEFKRLQCGLLRPASCTDRVIHAFPNKAWTSPGPEIFLLDFNGTPHPLG